MNGDVMPPAGARAEFSFLIPGVDEEISVATGSVLRIDRGDLLVKIENATGSVESGQLVRFSSSPSSTPADLSAATSPTPETDLPAVQATKTEPTATSTEAARYFAVGITKYLANDLKGALAAFTKAIELDPTKAAFFANRAAIYNLLKKPERGLADANEAIRLGPQLAIAYTIRANCYSGTHQFKRAQEDYDEAIRLDPKNADAYNDRGLFCWKQGKNKLAIEDFTRAIELTPADVDVLTNRARLYQAIGQTQLAKRDFARVRELKAQPKPTSARPEQDKEESP
jgi:Tfp pilus assembly protein PilF